MAKSAAPPKRVAPQKSSRWPLVLALVGAMVLGSVGGYVFSRVNPQALAQIMARLHSTTTSASATGTPHAGPTGTATATVVAGSPAAMLQQFNTAITSYDAQPMDAQTQLHLIIPKIHVNAPIVERGLVDGWMVVAPGQDVTHFIYSAYPGALGNSVMYSHAGTVFRHLDSLAVGDIIVVQTPHGASQFRVRELQIVAPTDLSVIDSSQTAVLTLLTCYPFGVDSSRLAVIADLVGP